MHKTIISIGMGLAFLLTAAAARSQPPGDGEGRSRRGPMMNPLALLSDSEVRTALELNDEQKGFLDLLAEETRTANEEFMTSLEGRSREERQAAFGDFREKQAKEVDESLEEILGDEKLARYKQIRMQVAGPMMLMNPAVASEIGLTQKQQQDLQQAMRDSFMQMRQSGERPDPGQMREMIEKKVGEVLTDPQKERWAAMLGPPVAINMERLRSEMMGGFRRPPGGGGPGGPDGDRREERRRNRRPDRTGEQNPSAQETPTSSAQ